MLHLNCISSIFVLYLYGEQRVPGEHWRNLGGRCRDRGKYNWEWTVASPGFKVFTLLDAKVILDENIQD